MSQPDRPSGELKNTIEAAWLAERSRLEKCIEEEVPDCTARCPFRMDIRDIMGRLKKGQINGAYRRFYNAVGFPFIVSRCCDAPCRQNCVMKKRGGAIDIPRLERALLRYTLNTKPNRINMPQRPEKIAIVGAGMSGLGCALRLLNLKYQVSVFEKTGVPGGCIRETAGAELVDEEIARQFMYENCEWHYNEQITDPVSLLENGYHAVYIATGAGGDDFGILQDGASGICVSKVPGIYFGGRITGASPMEALAQGMQTAAQIEGYFKTGVMRVPEKKEESAIVLAERFFKEKPAVVPSDDGEFTKEEAIEEAGRCAQCRCDACGRGCGLMEYYRRGPKRLSAEVYVSVRPGTLDGNGTVATRIIGSCNHCGYCTDVCPSSIDIDSYLLKSHALMTAKETMPWAWHEYWLNDLAFSMKDAAVTMIDRKKGNPYLFFPGCQTGGPDPCYVTESFRLLKKLEPQTGLMLTCCGAPALWASAPQAQEEALSKIRNVWEAAGKPVFILSCPSCMKVFGQFLPEIETVSLYEYLAAHKITPAKSGDGKLYKVFDPCASRGRELLQQSVRDIAAAGGFCLAADEEDAVCCSYGGHTDLANPRYTDWLAKKRAFAAEEPYLTYCVNCRDTFVSKGKEAVHILDLILDLDHTDYAPPGANARRRARLALKDYLENGMPEPDDPDMLYGGTDMPANEKFFAPDAELSEKLEKRRLIWEDLQEVVLSLEETGDKIEDTEAQCFFGHRMLGNMTYWVKYRMEDGRYRLLSAYAHRMKIEG